MIRHLTLALLCLAMTTACSSAGSNTGKSSGDGAGIGPGASDVRQVVPGQPIDMVPGDRVGLPDQSTLRYVEVESDSRCPPGVQCIQAGEARLQFELTRAGVAAERAIVVSGKPAPTRLGAWNLHLLALDFSDAPKATLRIDAAP